MTSSRSSHAPVFPKSFTWIGVLILGSALASQALPGAVAASLGVSTSSVNFTELSAPNGIFTGGQKLDFATGIGGFGAGAFSALGRIGMERTLGVDENRREEYEGDLLSSNVNPGGVSTWESNGIYFPRQDQTLVITNNVRTEGDTVSWSTRVQSLLTGSMTNNRIVWDATLADSYTPIYSDLGGGVLVVADSSGRHPALAIKASTTAGVVSWGGPGGFTTPLVNDTRQPTAYVYNTVAMDFTVSVVVTLLDHDPCSRDEALARAAIIAGVIGGVTPSYTSCLGDAIWSGAAGEVTTLGLELDPRASPLLANEVSNITVEGLPAGAEVSGFTPSESGFSLDLDLSVDTEPGEYDVAVLLLTTTTQNGVESVSKPFRSTARLTVTPLFVPEPEPEPIPDPEPEPEVINEPVVEPEVVDEPIVEPEVAPEPEIEPEVVDEPVVEPEEEVIAAPSPAPAPRSVPAEEVVVFTVAPTPAVITPRLVFVEPIVPEAIREPEPETSDEDENPGPILVAKPFEPSVSLVPRPLEAGALLGASMLVAVLAGGLIAFLRRRHSREDAETEEWR
jgi:hypothetical protein